MEKIAKETVKKKKNCSKNQAELLNKISNLILEFYAEKKRWLIGGGIIALSGFGIWCTIKITMAVVTTICGMFLIPSASFTPKMGAFVVLSTLVFWKVLVVLFNVSLSSFDTGCRILTGKPLDDDDDAVQR